MREVILGISAFCHDSVAALLLDGEIVAAAQDDRFTTAPPASPAAGWIQMFLKRLSRRAASSGP